MKIGNEVTSVCFTGHRDLTNIEIKNTSMRLSKLLSVLIEHHSLKECFAGGAVGFDTVAAQTVLSLKSYYPELKLNLILPCHGQENSWNANQKSEYYHIKDHADQVRVLAPFFYNGCMQARNRELLKCADLCIAYLRKGTSSGGSLNTVLQATKMRIPVINLANKESEYIL